MIPVVCSLCWPPLFFPIDLSAQEKENIVLLPIDVAPEFEAQKELIGTEIQKL